MDTISSRESNTNYLPLAGVIAGVAALLLAIFAFVKISSLKNEIAELNKLNDRVTGIESQVSQTTNAVQIANNAAQIANDTRNSLMNVARDTNNSFKQVSDQLGEIRTRLDSRPAGRAPATATAQGGGATTGGAATPAAPSGDVYVVKSGDNGTKISAATGFSITQLEAVNAGIDWRKLHIGQKIVLPKK